MILTYAAADWLAILAHLRRVGQGELADWLEARLPAGLADRPPTEPVSVAVGRRYALVTALEARDALSGR